MTSSKHVARSCVFVSSALVHVAAIAGQPGQNSLPIPMRLELELDNPTCVVYENLTFKVRIVNPNSFAVELRGFEMDSYIEPEVHLLLNEKETFRLRHTATDSAWTGRPVMVSPQRFVEKHRFLWNDNSTALGWPEEPGVFQLQLRTNLYTVRVEGETERRHIDWDRPIVELRVLPASLLDRQASEWLKTRFEETRTRPSTPGVPRNVNLERIRINDDFLRRFPDSSYVPAIRWELGRLLMGQLGNGRIPEDELADSVNLFEESVTFCLDRGGAYAEEFLSWDMEKGGSRLMELALKHSRHALLERIARELDLKYPSGEAAKLYRRLIVVGVTESAANARPVLQELLTNYPDSEYARPATMSLRYLERRERKRNAIEEQQIEE